MGRNMERKCETCRFAVKSPREKMFRCRRYPPLDPEYRGGFPLVYRQNWCGEWAPPGGAEATQGVTTEDPTSRTEQYTPPSGNRTSEYETLVWFLYPRLHPQTSGCYIVDVGDDKYILEYDPTVGEFLMDDKHIRSWAHLPDGPVFAD